MATPSTPRARQAASVPEDDEDLLTVAEAAPKMHISKRYLYELVERGEVTHVRLPSETGQRNHIRIQRREIRRFIAAHLVAADSS